MGLQWARGRSYKNLTDRRYYHFTVEWSATVPWGEGLPYRSAAPTYTTERG